jgi:putative transcriptional regulator
MQAETGSFLMAHPLLEDDHFSRSIVLVTQGSSDTYLGLIVNKLSDYTLNQALQGDWPEWPLYLGGPVSTDSLYYLHRRPDLILNSELVRPGIYFGGDFDSLREAIDSEWLQPDDIKFMAGYSGWAEGQLESELEEGSWVSVNDAVQSDWWYADDAYRTLAQRWPDELKLWLNSPEVPYWN